MKISELTCKCKVDTDWVDFAKFINYMVCIGYTHNNGLIRNALPYGVFIDKSTVMAIYSEVDYIDCDLEEKTLDEVLNIFKKGE